MKKQSLQITCVHSKFTEINRFSCNTWCFFPFLNEYALDNISKGRFGMKQSMILKLEKQKQTNKNKNNTTLV